MVRRGDDGCWLFGKQLQRGKDRPLSLKKWKSANLRSDSLVKYMYSEMTLKFKQQYINYPEEQLPNGDKRTVHA